MNVIVQKENYIKKGCIRYSDMLEHDIKKVLINCLVRKKHWGEAYTHDIRKYLPKHLRGEKITDKAIESMQKAEWLIIPKHKGGEPMFSLNPKKVKEVMEFYETHSNN